MKKVLLAVLGFVLLLALVKTGWGQNVHGPKRFELFYEQSDALSTVRILLDKVTGKKYIYYRYGSGAGLTKLE